MSTPAIVMPDGDPLCVELFGAPGRRTTADRLGGIRVWDDAPVADPAVILERCRDARAVIFGWSLPESVLELPNVEVVSFMGTGAANFVDLDAAARHGVTVCNAPGYGDAAVAEHALALLLTSLRDIPSYDAQLRSGVWPESRPAREVGASVVGLVGFGGIARHLARVLTALGATVLVWTRTPDRYVDAYPDVTFVSLDDLLERSDVVSLHVALTHDTRGLIDASALRRMREGALLVNTARAELVDEAVLVELVASGRLRAAVDVFAPEPLPADNPYRALPGLIMTPHVAFNTPDATERMADITLGNIEAFFAGSPRNTVT